MIQINNLIVSNIIICTVYFYKLTQFKLYTSIRCIVVEFYIDGIVAVFFYVNRCFLPVSDDDL